MGAKKKGMASRLAKMSDDERARYLQHRADMEEEVRRRKEQLISAFLKNKIKKEEAFSRLNTAKLNQNWHQILRKLKCKEMRENVQHIREYIERLMNLKNRTIKNLLRELDDAEEQYTNNFQQHLNHASNMIEFGIKSLEQLDADSSKEVKESLKAYGKEKHQLLKTNYEDITHLRTVVYEHGIISKKELRLSYEYYLQKSNNLMTENAKQLEELRRSKEAVIWELWKKISIVLRNYIETTDVRRAHHAELQALDVESAKEVASNEFLIHKLENELQKLDEKFIVIKAERMQEIRNHSDTVKTTRMDFLRVKIELQKDLTKDEKQAIILTESFNKAMDCLTNFEKKGLNLLQIMQACRKLETHEEKVLAFKETIRKNGFEGISMRCKTSSSSSSKGDAGLLKRRVLRSRTAAGKSIDRRTKNIVELDKLEINGKSENSSSSSHYSASTMGDYDSHKSSNERVKTVSRSSSDSTIIKPTRSKSCVNTRFKSDWFKSDSLPQLKSAKTAVTKKSNSLDSSLISCSKPFQKRSITEKILRDLEKIKQAAKEKSTAAFEQESIASSAESKNTKDDISSREDENKLQSVDSSIEEYEAGAKLFANLSKLDGLWAAYNRVLFDCSDLRKEVKMLELENEVMKDNVRSVLEAAVLTNDLRKYDIIEMPCNQEVMYSAPPKEQLI